MTVRAQNCTSWKFWNCNSDKVIDYSDHVSVEFNDNNSNRNRRIVCE